MDCNCTMSTPGVVADYDGYCKWCGGHITSGYIARLGPQKIVITDQDIAQELRAYRFTYHDSAGSVIKALIDVFQRMDPKFDVDKFCAIANIDPKDYK